MTDRKELSPSQIQYLIDKGWIDRRRVERLASKAAAQYELRGLEEAKPIIQETV